MSKKHLPKKARKVQDQMTLLKGIQDTLSMLVQHVNVHEEKLFVHWGVVNILKKKGIIKDDEEIKASCREIAARVKQENQQNADNANTKSGEVRSEESVSGSEGDSGHSKSEPRLSVESSNGESTSSETDGPTPSKEEKDS